MPKIIELKGEKNRWSFSTLGGRMVSWEGLDGATWRKVCRGDGQKKSSDDHHHASVMFPWVNRIGGISWSLEGERVPVDTVRPRGHLHGLVFDSEFTVKDAGATKLALQSRVEPGEFYPRAVECVVTYSIVQKQGVEALDVSIISKNVSPGDQVAYVTTGIHPYFLNPFGGKVDEMELICAAKKEFAVDEELIPTGLTPVTAVHDFGKSRPIGATLFDSGFELDAAQSPVAELKSRNFSLAVHAGENCRYMQIFVPAHREEIALEPQSGGADAFRVPEYGLRRLKPGESFTTAMQFAASFR